MVTPKMLGHIRPDYIFNYSSKPGKVDPGRNANFFCIHNGYAYEFFTDIKIIAIYKVIVDDNDYVTDFEFVKIISIDNQNRSYRWIIVDDYAVAIGVTAISTSTVSGTTSNTVSASAYANLYLSLFKLDGTSVTESYINHGSLTSAYSSGGGSSTVTDTSTKRADLICMIDKDTNVRIATYTYAKANGTFISNGNSYSVNATASVKSAIVHFNIRDIISSIESGEDASIKIVKESGTGSLFMTGFNDYVMYSKQTLDGTTTAKNGLWKYTINDDNTCDIDTSAIVETPTNIPTVFTLNGYRFGEYDHSSGAYIFTASQTTATNAVDWYIQWLGRSDKEYDTVISSVKKRVAKSRNIPSMDSIGGYFIHYESDVYTSNISYDINTGTSEIDKISGYTLAQISSIMYASKIDISNDSILYHNDYKRLPLLKLAGAYIVTYGGRWYCIGMRHTSMYISNTAIAGDTTNDLYGRIIFTTIEYDEATDEFYNVFKGRKPALSADNNIIEITRIDYIINTDDATMSTPYIYILDADTNDRISLVSCKEVYTSKSNYNTHTHLCCYGTIDCSNHPIILNPGHKLYLCCGTPDAPTVYHIYPEFTMYGCVLSNS